jgi:chaperone modulatory protein CbpM
MSIDVTTVIIDEQHLLAEAETWLSLDELCERCRLQPPLVIELVGLGLVTPVIAEANEWQFRTEAVPTLHQALRLRQELDLDWQGVAVAMDLMGELRELRQQVDSLQRQLAAHQ